ncbi:E3 ubiquitin-protein ligase listerin [Eudromia elegans]
MGGKNKQRTKGNVRPSSSGRAAELLAKERGTVPGFIGFGTSQSDLGYVPAVQGAEEIDSLVDADFRMVLRKLSKRDVTTKLKAMQEFGTMCKEREAEVVKGVLPYWPRIYCKISLDHDRRVREATQQSFEQLILKVKKHLAPYLKSIMGYWLIAQCDVYSPAASAARVAFEKAFPSSKQPEALAFCKDEILNVLQDHLLKETPDTLSDPQTVPEEEREAKFFRILTCSLLALKKLISMLPKKEVHLLEEKLMSLLSQNKFWKYSKHSIPQVRSAFFEVVSAFCQYLPELVQAEAPRVCPAVLLSIDDSDAVVCPALWEAALCTLATIEDCWIHVNARKGVLPKLWTVLREGGRGLATVIYPNLLPFISKVPPGIAEPKLDYFRTFFSSIIQGLSSERAVSSHSESSAIIAAFMECLRFVLLLKMDDEDEQRQIHQMLIYDQLIPLTDAVLREPRLQSGPLFYQIAETLSSWEAKVELSSDNDTDETFQKLLSNFWDCLLKMCVLHVDTLDANEKSLLAISGMLEILRNPKSAARLNNRKSLKIRFTDEDESERNAENGKFMEVKNNSDSEIQSEQQHYSPLRKERLENLVCSLAELSIVYVSEQKSERHLKFLSALLNSFSSKRIFHVLLEHGNGASCAQAQAKSQEKITAHHENPSVQFLHLNLITWLKEDWRRETHFLVDILYSVLNCCNSSDERKIILDDLTKMDLKWTILLQIIQKACSSTTKLSLVSDWLKGDTLGEKLVMLADDLCHLGLKPIVASSESSSSERWTLLSLVLSQHIKNESLIGEAFVEKIIDKLQTALSKARDLSEAGNTEPSVSFICDVASSFFSSVKGCLLMPSSEDLLFTIFQLCAQRQDTTQLTDLLICKLKHTWMSGVNSLVHQLRSMQKQSTFLHKSALWVKNQIQSSSLDVKSLQVLISAVSDLLSKLLEAEGPSGYLVGAFVEHVTPNKTEWDKLHKSLSMEWMHKPLLEGRLSMNCEHLGSYVKLCGTNKLPGHLCASALLSKMVLFMLENGIVPGNDDAERMKVDHIIAELLYSLQWIEELANPSYLLLEYTHMLEEMHITYEKFSTLSNTANLQQTIFDRSEEHGRLWSLTMAKVIREGNTGSCGIKQLFKTSEGFLPLTEGRVHTLQCLSAVLIEEEKKELVFDCVAKLMTCVQTELSSTDGAFGCLSILNSCLNDRNIDCDNLLPGILKIIISWKNDNEDSFLFSCNLKEKSAQLLGLNIEIIRFVPVLLKCMTTPLTDNEWDFIMCSMLAWLETTSENHSLYHIPLVQIFACASCDLASALSAYFEAAPPETIANLPVNLISEWKDFFSEGIHNLLLPLLVKVTGETKNASESAFQNSVLTSLGEALTYISKDQLLNHKLPAKFVAGQKTNLSDKLQTLLNTLSPLLLFRARPVQISVYRMLYKLMPELPVFDDEDLKSYGDEEEESALSPPAALMSVLATQELLLENILECIPVGEFAVIQPLSDEFCLVLGYLLTWKLTLTFFKAASSQLRVLYSQYLRRTKSLNKLLYHLFRLMPENPVISGPISEVPNKDTKTFFTEELNLDVKGTGLLSSQIPHLACSVYHITLKDLPAMVRLWWNSCEKRVFNVVDKFTSKYVSSVLSSQEIASVQTSTQLFNGMTVKARSAAREVIATYSVDDIFIELIIQLPSNYPLGSITVESGKRVGVAVQQWRNWMLQLSTYLTHQNGSIMEGLSLWKNNVDKRFEGVEDCMICFSVIHGSNYSLPKKACRTCKKKFHSACLYKWFTSSNKSTCPLCRETFF